MHNLAIREYKLPRIDGQSPGAQNKYIITGGPGFGITTTIRALSNMGFKVVREAARKLILDEKDNPRPILPWTDRANFDQRLAELQIMDYKSFDSGNGITFFDRGIPDFVGWRHYTNFPLDPYMELLRSYPYEQNVFMTVPWEEIYVRDENRTLTFGQSREIHEMLLLGYLALGYQVHLLPKVSAEERAKLISAHVISTQW